MAALEHVESETFEQALMSARKCMPLCLFVPSCSTLILDRPLGSCDYCMY